MSLNFSVQPGKIMAADELVTNAKLNQGFVPVIQAEGTIGVSDMGAGDYSGILAVGDYFYAAATLAGATYTAVFSPAVTTYTDGVMAAVKVNAANPASPLLDLGAGAKPLYQYGGRTRVEAGDLTAASVIEVRYNSTVIAGGCWEVMSLIGPRPARSPFTPASAYVGGEQGLVPAPPVSAARQYLRDDGTWADAVAATVAAVAPSVTQLEVFKQQTFV